MGDSFRAEKAKARDAAADIEARLSRLTGGDDDAVPRKSGGVRLLTAEAQRDEDFRVACGAYVKGTTKPGVRTPASVIHAGSFIRQPSRSRSYQRRMSALSGLSHAPGCAISMPTARKTRR